MLPSFIDRVAVNLRRLVFALFAASDVESMSSRLPREALACAGADLRR